MKPYSDSPRLLRIFLCHSSGDKPAVRQLYRRLSADGFEPWLDEEKLLPGQRWREAIPRAVRDSDMVIVCLSNLATGKAGYVHREIKYALDVALDQPQDVIFLIPLKLEECEVPESLSDWQWVNFFEEGGYTRLKMALDYRAEALRVGAGKSQVPPKTAEKAKTSESQPAQAPPTVKVSTAADERGDTILSHAIGIETLGGVFTKIIPEGTRLPHRLSEIFSTAADDQASVEVHVLAGMRPLAQQNLSLGRFHLVGIPPAPRGMPQIEVTFDIDANGIVNVSAKDLGTQKEQKITITASSGLSKDEVDKMMREAESHAEEDKKRHEEIETRNRADQAVYGAERMLRDTGDNLPAFDRSAMNSAIADLKKAIESHDRAAMTRGMDALTQAQYKAAEALYKQR